MTNNPEGGSGPRNRPPQKWSDLLSQGWVWILLVIVGVVAVRLLVFNTSRNDTIGLNRVAELASTGRLAGIDVEGDAIAVRLNNDNVLRSRKEMEASIYDSLANLGVNPEILNSLNITFRNPPRFAAILSGFLIILPMLIILGFFLFIMRQSGAGPNRVL